MGDLTMPKDDYFVITYRLLTYLYTCLKRDKSPDPAMLSAGYFEIGASYWEYIIKNLYEDGYISGILVIQTVTPIDGIVKIQPNVKITPKGIQHLSDNSMFKRIKEFAKDVAAIIPV